MKLLVLSDIHANLSALDAVLEEALAEGPDAVAYLGDYIDYGMRPNEVVARLAALDLPVACAIWGNHEDAILAGHYGRFSTPRGEASARYMETLLEDDTRTWLEDIPGKSGMLEFEWAGLKCLAIHGSLADPYWKALDVASADLSAYEAYDVVLSGHNHIPNVYQAFYAADAPLMRNKRRCLFVNPGSVGQPRNHDTRAHYALLDSQGPVTLGAVPYDIAFEQALYNGNVDDFYRARLALGV